VTVGKNPKKGIWKGGNRRHQKTKSGGVEGNVTGGGWEGCTRAQSVRRELPCIRKDGNVGWSNAKKDLLPCVGYGEETSRKLRGGTPQTKRTEKETSCSLKYVATRGGIRENEVWGRRRVAKHIAREFLRTEKETGMR